MDIDILLALQEFRNGSGAFLASFFSKMTWLGELNTAIVIMALIYWCISKDIPRALRVVLGFLVLLVAFSRNYLGRAHAAGRSGWCRSRHLGHVSDHEADAMDKKTS